MSMVVMVWMLTLSGQGPGMGTALPRPAWEMVSRKLPWFQGSRGSVRVKDQLRSTASGLKG